MWESSKHFPMYLSLNFPLAWLGFADKCMENFKTWAIIPSIPARHQSSAFTVENLLSDILNLQTANISEISNHISPIFRKWGGLSCTGLPCYIVTYFCMHGHHFTKVEEANFVKVYFTIWKTKFLEKNPVEKS